MSARAESGAPSPELARRMRSEGMRAKTGWFYEGTQHPGTHAEAASAGEEAGEQTHREQRERQQQQTKRDSENNWRRCYAKAPDDDDARALVSRVARAIADPTTRRAVNIAVEHPQAAILGDKLRKTRNPIARILLAVNGRAS